MSASTASEVSVFRSAYTTFVVCDYRETVEVVVRGEYDLSSTDTSHLVLEHVGNLIGDAPRPVVVDLAGVSFFDAAGISFLLRLDRVARLASTTSSVRQPSAQARLVLDVVGLSDFVGDTDET